MAALPASWLNDKNSPAYRHLAGANYAFADGHTTWYKPDQVLNGPAPSMQPTFSIQ
ncbi:MAG: H-X9-DG-CTERM domain-containing protein [Acidimicrobiales bacterium]